MFNERSGQDEWDAYKSTISDTKKKRPLQTDSALEINYWLNKQKQIELSFNKVFFVESFLLFLFNLKKT